jgi:hypothetical protein
MSNIPQNIIAPRILPLTQGLWTIVDAEDYEYLVQWKWFAKKGGCGETLYAARSVREGKHVTTIRMHRVIMQKELAAISAYREVDHLNHNPLDNRKENLKVVTKEENLANRRMGNKKQKKDNFPF